MILNDMGVITKLNPTHTAQIDSLDWCVCIDISGSTAAKIQTNRGIETVLQCEIDFVKQFISNFNIQSKKSDSFDQVLSRLPRCILWDSAAKIFKYSSIDQLVPSDGTEPASIFKSPETATAISECDAMLILTDGEIDQNYVTDFGNHMLKIGGQLKCVVGVLVGPRPLSPANVNVSVLVPGMVGTYNGCILHYSGTDPYVLWSSGEFKNNWNPPDIDASTTWDQLKSFPIKSLPRTTISSCDPTHVAMLNKNGYVPLGSLSSSLSSQGQGQNIFFNPTKLLQSSPRWDEIKEYPFDRICQYFKVIGKCKELYIWFKEHMEELLRQILIDDIDRINFEDLLDKMSANKHKCSNKNKTDDILSSYIKIRNRTVARMHIATDADIDFALENQNARQLMQFYRNMVQVMQEDVNAAEDRYGRMSHDMYTTSSISSIRYSIPPIIKSKARYNSSLCDSYDDHLIHLSKDPIITATFHNPFLWKEQFVQAAPTYSGFGTIVECTICCDEKVTIPFILFRQKINCRTYPEELTTNLLKYYYQGILCDKCAEFFCQQKRDPNRVSCIGGFPLIKLDAVPPSVRENYIKNFSEYTNLKYLNQKSTPRDRNVQRDENNHSFPLRIVSSISSGVYNFVSSIYNKSTKQSLLSDGVVNNSRDYHNNRYHDHRDYLDHQDNQEAKENDRLTDTFEHSYPHYKNHDVNVQRNRILDLLKIMSQQMKKKYSEGFNDQLVEIFDIYQKSIVVCRG
jgi:hypothetical protein